MFAETRASYARLKRAESAARSLQRDLDEKRSELLVAASRQDFANALAALSPAEKKAMVAGIAEQQATPEWYLEEGLFHLLAHNLRQASTELDGRAEVARSRHGSVAPSPTSGNVVKLHLAARP